MFATDNVKTIAKEGSIAFFFSIIGRAIRFILQIYIARILSIEAYGLYSLGRSFFELLQLPARFGLPNSVVRFGSIYLGIKDEKRLKGLLLSALFFSGIIASICAVLVFVLSDWISLNVFKKNDLAPILRIFCLGLPFFVILSVLVAFFRVYKKMVYYSGVSDFLSPSLNLLLVYLFVISGFGLLGAIYGFVLSTVISMLISLFLLLKLFPSLYSFATPVVFETTRLFRYSLAVAFIGISNVLIDHTDRIMIGALSNIKEVGLYNASATIAIQMTIFLTAFNTIFAPMIADLHNKKLIKDLEYLFKAVTKWVFTLTFILLVLVFCFGKEILSIFGNEFSVNSQILLVLALGQFVNASVGAVGFILTMTGRHKLEFYNGFFLAILNIILNYVLIPKYGAMGAAIATGFSVSFINIVRLVEVFLIYHMHPYNISYIKPLLSGVLVFVIWQLVKSFVNVSHYFWIPVSIIISICYFILLLIVGLDESDKMIVRSVVNRF